MSGKQLTRRIEVAKYSIIVPVYNAEQYLPETIESVLRQTYDDYELILVNDGSTDQSATICQKYALNDRRIRVYHKENTGQYQTRQYGFNKSTGEFILYLDADDVLINNSLEIIDNYIKRYQCTLLLFRFQRFTDFKDIKQFASQTNLVSCIDDHRLLYKTVLSNTNNNSVCCKVIGRSFLNETSNMDVASVRYGEDLIKVLEIIKQNPKTLIVEDILYCYRLNTSSVTGTLDICRYVKDHIAVRSSVYSSICDFGGYDYTDFIEYRTYEVKLLMGVVGAISMQKLPQKKKIKLLKELYNSDYYHNVINTGIIDAHHLLRNDKIKWCLFSKGAFYPLIWLNTLWHVIH